MGCSTFSFSAPSSSSISSPSSLSSLSTAVPVFIIALTMFATNSVSGFHTGGPSYSCRNLIPGHSNGTQPDPPPYRLTVSSRVVPPGGSTTVTLESTGDFPFRGFLCAVSTLEDEDNNSVGRMSHASTASSASASNLIAPVTCSRSTPDTGMTHTGKEDKFRVDFDWTAPLTASTGQQFKLRCTCVMNFFRCWTDLRVDLVVGRPGSSPPRTSTLPSMPGFSAGSNNGFSTNAHINNVNNNNDNNNNNGAGVSGVSLGLGSGRRNFSPSPLTPRLVNNGGLTPAGGNNVPTSPLNNFAGTPTNNAVNPAMNDNFPLLPTNRLPNLFSDNSVGLPLDPSNNVFVPFSRDGNPINQDGSNLVLIPNGAVPDASSLLQGLNQINVDSNFQRPNQNSRTVPNPTFPTQTRGNFPSSNSFPPSRQNFPNQESTNRNDPFGGSQGGIGRGLSQRGFPNSGSQNRLFPVDSGSRRPSDSNRLDQSLIRGSELFALPPDPPRDQQAFDFPAGFFMTPGALQRFRQRNSL